ncbi:hypothetical protein C7999DRAFT_35797 [Corynascus novoguineensis]|uniref:Uncharacterized protein n=1 Tax=Corynascus novoguineensis TaxID=1126955 RepID=A0AAN7CLA1_9PEZI|nr:hypothetical protein C7999DRAFT_35797 [Corynascus novoguineensis]
MPYTARSRGKNKARGRVPSAASGAASAAADDSPAESGATSRIPQASRKRRRTDPPTPSIYEERAVRGVPCTMCVKSALAGRSAGECRDHSGPGRRCAHCFRGSHKCQEIPASCVASAKDLTRVLKIDAKHPDSKSLRIILRNDLQRACAISANEEPGKEKEDDEDLASFVKIGRAVFTILSEVNALKKKRKRMDRKQKARERGVTGNDGDFIG